MNKNTKFANPMKVITGPETRWSYLKNYKNLMNTLFARNHISQLYRGYQYYKAPVLENRYP